MVGIADYSKFTWVDDVPGSVIGTMFSAARMQAIEDGLDDAAEHNKAGTVAARPAAAAANKGWLYYATDTGELFRSDGSTWTVVSTVGTLDPELSSVAGLTSAADKLAYYTGSGTAALAAFTAAARALMDDPDAATMLATLGINSPGTWHANKTITLASAAPGADIGFYALVSIPPGCPALTGIAYYVGATANGNARASLYNAAGTRVANRTSASAQPAANTFHQVPFDSTYTPAAGVYFMSLILSSATGTWFRGGAMQPTGHANGPGAGATLASVTPPTAPDAVTNGPYMTTY